MILLDSNIIIYAINTSSPRHKAAREFIQSKVRNLAVAHQNITETIRVLTHAGYPHPMNVSASVAAVSSILKSCVVVHPNQDTLPVALDLIQRYTILGNHIFDAYLVATMLSNDITKIATDNARDFSRYSGIEVVMVQ